MVIDAVPVTCQCGNVMQIKRIGIGKRIKCPQCSAPNLVCEPVETITQPPEIRLKPEPVTTTTVVVSPTRSTPPRRKYVALENISAVFRVLSILVFVVWFLSTCGSLVIASQVAGSQGGGLAIGVLAAQWLGYTILATIVACGLWACSELIQLAMHVQQNTYDSAYFR